MGVNTKDFAFYIPHYGGMTHQVLNHCEEHSHRTLLCLSHLQQFAKSSQLKLGLGSIEGLTILVYVARPDSYIDDDLINAHNYFAQRKEPELAAQTPDNFYFSPCDESHESVIPSRTCCAWTTVTRALAYIRPFKNIGHIIYHETHSKNLVIPSTEETFRIKDEKGRWRDVEAFHTNSEWIVRSPVRQDGQHYAPLDATAIQPQDVDLLTQSRPLHTFRNPMRELYRALDQLEKVKFKIPRLQLN